MGWQDLTPRPLNPTERHVLLTLFEAGGEQYAPLREQLDAATVTARCGCGCATVAVSVADASPPLRGEDGFAFSGVLPIEGTGRDVGVLVFVREGRLSSLEVHSWGDATAELPEPGDLRVVDRSGEIAWPVRVKLTSGEHAGKQGSVVGVQPGDTAERTEYIIELRRGPVISQSADGLVPLPPRLWSQLGDRLANRFGLTRS